MNYKTTFANIEFDVNQIDDSNYRAFCNFAFNDKRVTSSGISADTAVLNCYDELTKLQDKEGKPASFGCMSPIMNTAAEPLPSTYTLIEMIESLTCKVTKWVEYAKAEHVERNILKDQITQLEKENNRGGELHDKLANRMDKALEKFAVKLHYLETIPFKSMNERVANLEKNQTNQQLRLETIERKIDKFII